MRSLFPCKLLLIIGNKLFAKHWDYYCRRIVLHKICRKTRDFYAIKSGLLLCVQQCMYRHSVDVLLYHKLSSPHWWDRRLLLLLNMIIVDRLTTASSFSS